jgi:hypothetical protein
MAVEKERQPAFRRRILGMMQVANANREPDAFMGYLEGLSQVLGYSLAEAQQAYQDCLTQEMTDLAAARAPKWPEVRAYLLKQQAVTDWEAQADK